MWTVVSIEEADFGCEERLPGMPLMALVTIECDDGRRCQFECAENWLSFQEINEGDEWPEDIDEIDSAEASLDNMADWMEGYYEALEEAQ